MRHPLAARAKTFVNFHHAGPVLLTIPVRTLLTVNFFFPPISFLLFLNNCTKLQQEIQKKKLNQSRFNFISLPFDLSSLPFLIFFFYSPKKGNKRQSWLTCRICFIYFFSPFSLNCCVCFLPISELSLNYIPRTNVAGHIDKTPNREKIKFRFFSSFFSKLHGQSFRGPLCYLFYITS